jgi:hypothetical protein
LTVPHQQKDPALSSLRFAQGDTVPNVGFHEMHYALTNSMNLLSRSTKIFFIRNIP